MNLIGQIDRRLGAFHRDPPPPAIALDLPALARAGHLVPGSMDGRLAQEIRQIKQPLLRRIQGALPARARLVMVTGAVTGEGKTTLAIDLSMSLAAEADLAVLLVDADVRQRAAMRRLGVDQRSGLMDLLSDPALPLHETIRATEVPGLSVLPAGRGGELSTELLGSRAMDRLLERLLRECPDRVVVFDAPPLLAGSQARVLAPQMGQVVMVVEAWRTPARAVVQAFEAVVACAEVDAVLVHTEVLPRAPDGTRDRRDEEDARN